MRVMAPVLQFLLFWSADLSLASDRDLLFSLPIIRNRAVKSKKLPISVLKGICLPQFEGIRIRACHACLTACVQIAT